MASWLSRLRPDVPESASGASGVLAGEEPDSVPALRRRLAATVHEIDAAAGRLPGEAVVVARQVTDLAADVLRRSGDGLNVYGRVALDGVLRDYLPTTLRTFLAARSAADADVPALTRSLLGQLAVLHASLRESVAAVDDDDLRALEAQEIFLRTRFAGSDL